MNRKKIIALVMSCLMLVPTSVYAKGNKNSSLHNGNNIKVEKVKKNEEKKEDKKAQIETFKAQMKIKHETMKELRQQIKEVRQEIEKKTAQLAQISEDIKSGNKTFPQDALSTMLSKSEDLNADSSKLKSTAEASSDVNDAQSKVNKKDFNNALASMDKVIAKMQARLDALKKLNSDLDAVLKTANSVDVPSQDQTTSNVTNPDSTSNQQ